MSSHPKQEPVNEAIIVVSPDDQVNYMGHIGRFTGLHDRNGQPVHLGDTLEFDPREWGGGNNTFIIGFEGGELTGLGSVGDIGEWCKIINKWNEK